MWWHLLLIALLVRQWHTNIWGSLASRPSILGELQATEGHCLFSKVHKDLEMIPKADL